MHTTRPSRKVYRTQQGPTGISTTSGCTFSTKLAYQDGEEKKGDLDKLPCGWALRIQTLYVLERVSVRERRPLEVRRN